MKLELDVFYELWDRAGSQGLDTWHDLAEETLDAEARQTDPSPDADRRGRPAR